MNPDMPEHNICQYRVYLHPILCSSIEKIIPLFLKSTKAEETSTLKWREYINNHIIPMFCSISSIPESDPL